MNTLASLHAWDAFFVATMMIWLTLIVRMMVGNMRRSSITYVRVRAAVSVPRTGSPYRYAWKITPESTVYTGTGKDSGR